MNPREMPTNFRSHDNIGRSVEGELGSNYQCIVCLGFSLVELHMLHMLSV